MRDYILESDLMPKEARLAEIKNSGNLINKNSKRWKVFERDGFKCKECGSIVDLTIDHIIPKSLGGGERIKNLQTLCRSCNFAKGNSLPVQTPTRWLKAR